MVSRTGAECVYLPVIRSSAETGMGRRGCGQEKCVFQLPSPSHLRIGIRALQHPRNNRASPRTLSAGNSKPITSQLDWPAPLSDTSNQTRELGS